MAAVSAAMGMSPFEVVYDHFLGSDGNGYLFTPFFNLVNNSMDGGKEMIEHPLTHIGVGDAGAHNSTLNDAANPTVALTHWCRDRSRGDKIPLELMVHKQTKATAHVRMKIMNH